MSQWYKLNITDSGPIGVGAFDGPTGQAPSVNGAVISSNNIFFQSASTTYPGMVNTTSQSFGGKKTFNNQIAIQGDTSGIVTINSSTGTYNFTLPTTVGPTGQFLTSNGGGPMYWSTGTTGPTGPTGASSTVTGPTGPTGSYGPLGNVLRVDSIYGNDLTASIGGLPYLTVNKAIEDSSLASSSIPLTIWIMPGIYNLSSAITIPSYVSLRGMSTQTTTIQMTNVSADNTTLLTMNANTRVEDLTLNISSNSIGTNIKCIEFPSGTQQSAKLRTSVCNVIHSGVSGTAYGILSSGTGPTGQSSSNAIRGCTINVSANSSIIGRGIIVNNINRFSIRDTNVNVSGVTADGVGVETTNAGSIAELRTSTIGGVTHDINRTAGNMELGFTDLLNSDCNGNSFSTTTEPANILFGVIGNLGSNQTYQLVPGTLPLAQLPSSAFEFPFTQNVIIISTLLKFTGTIGTGVTVSLHIHLNGSVTPSIIVTLNQGETYKINNTTSILCKTNDTIHAEVVTVGNPGAGTFLAVIGLY